MLLLCAQRTSTTEYEPRYECAPGANDSDAQSQVSRNWPRIREAIMVALTPFKEAREAVIRGLEQLERAEAPA